MLAMPGGKLTRLFRKGLFRFHNFIHSLLRVVDRIVQNSMNLREAFALYAQRTQQESIPIQDFVAILHDYAIGFSKTMLFDFVRRLDSNKDGRISQDEFLRALEVCFSRFWPSFSF